MAKKTRKELLKQEDAFVQAANQGAQWIQANRNRVILGAAAAFLTIAAIWGGAEYTRFRDEKASQTFADAAVLRAAEVVEEGADPTAEPPTFETEQAKQQALVEKFEGVVAQTGSTGVSMLARFYLADAQEKLGNAEGAMQTLSTLVDSLSSQDSLRVLAVERLAYLQEGRGDHEEAIKTLERAGHGDLERVKAEKGPFHGDFNAYHRARLLASVGQRDRAKTLLERVESLYPQSALNDEVKYQLMRLNDTAGAGTGAPAPDAKAKTPEPDAPEGAAAGGGKGSTEQDGAAGNEQEASEG